jgi:DNA processing protein
MTELEAIISLNGILGLGPKRIFQLLKKFGSAKAVYSAEAGDILSINGFGETFLSALKEGPDLEFVENQVKTAETVNARIITINDSDYPEKLKNIYDPPVVLHIKGDIGNAKHSMNIGVVGTRHPTPYGRGVTSNIVSGLAREKVTVVSGLARGIDTIAHRAALDNRGKTIAVLGCGLDYYYPFSNRKLYQTITENGALISEFPFGTPPEPGHFPRRNRIISGLSHGVVIVEAGHKSGALITADYAMEQGIDVYAVPGNITSGMSIGTNRLIRDGALMALSAEDILTNLGREVTYAAIRHNQDPLRGDEQRIFEMLSGQPMHIDEIVRLSNTKPQQLHAILLSLEVKGIVSQVGGMKYVRANG